MIQVLVHHEVADYQNWRTAFDAALDFRRRGVERNCRVFGTAGNPNDLTLVFEGEDLPMAQGYMNSEELRKKMKTGRRRRNSRDSLPGKDGFDSPQRG